MKDSYALLYMHELDADHRTELNQNHFQDGPSAWTYLTGAMRTPVSRMQLLQHDKEWDAIDVLADIGVNANTITLLATRIKAKNAKRPAANRHNQTEMTEKLLECIFTSSKHFSESASDAVRCSSQR